jgi:hypothetical protein
MTSARENWFAEPSMCVGAAGTVALGSSPATFAAPNAGVLYLTGGTGVAISLVRGGVSTALGILAGSVRLRMRDNASITYLTAPTAVWVPD